jgi:hypothetical protein
MANQGASGRGIGSELGFAASSIRATFDLTPYQLVWYERKICHLTGPLLARPAGANALLLANVFPRHRLPGWLVQPEGKSLKLGFLPVEPARGVRLRGLLSNLKTVAHVGQAGMGRSRLAPCWLARQVPTFYC